MKRIRLEVCPSGKLGPWVLKVSGKNELFVRTQGRAILKAMEWAQWAVQHGKKVSLLIKRPDGTIREERTYPRSSDPRRTKG